MVCGLCFLQSKVFFRCLGMLCRKIDAAILVKYDDELKLAIYLYKL